MISCSIVMLWFGFVVWVRGLGCSVMVWVVVLWFGSVKGELLTLGRHDAHLKAV